MQLQNKNVKSNKKANLSKTLNFKCKKDKFHSLMQFSNKNLCSSGKALYIA